MRWLLAKLLWVPKLALFGLLIYAIYAGLTGPEGWHAEWVGPTAIGCVLNIAMIAWWQHSLTRPR